MDYRTHFQKTMAREPMPCPPLDIGATTLTAMSKGCQESLKCLLGFEGKGTSSNSGVDLRILEWAGTGFRSVGRIIPLPSLHTRQISETKQTNCWGITKEYQNGYWQISNPPLAGATRDDLRAYSWPQAKIDDNLLSKWVAEAKRLHAEGQYVVIAEHPVYGILELGCWMCGYDDFLYRLTADPDFVKTFFEIVFNIQMKIVDVYYSALGPYIDLTTSGDDFGMQTGPLLSPDLFDRQIRPWFSARIARTKELGQCYYWHHTCGSVVGLLDQIIECGVDILNPIQTSATGMNPVALKEQVGRRLTFWGGMDVQDFLRAACPDMVRKHVHELASAFADSGGYVMAPAHNMQDDIPSENIVAWVEALRIIASGI